MPVKAKLCRTGIASGKGIVRRGALPQTPENFDKGFGVIAAAAWYGGIWARQWFQRQSLYQNRRVHIK